MLTNPKMRNLQFQPSTKCSSPKSGTRNCTSLQAHRLSKKMFWQTPRGPDSGEESFVGIKKVYHFKSKPSRQRCILPHSTTWPATLCPQVGHQTHQSSSVMAQNEIKQVDPRALFRQRMWINWSRCQIRCLTWQ